MPKPYTRSSSSGPGPSAGFSLIELLVGMAVALVVTGAALSLAMTTRNLYEADQARIRVNQSLRAGRDFIATDVQHVGERLGVAFPIVELVDGSAGAPDELVVRRNLLDTVLNVCWDVTGTQDWIIFGIDPGFPTPPGPGCFKMPGAENYTAWRSHRLANGAEDDGSATSTDVRAYMWNPTTGVGQFFNYRTESQDPNFDTIFAESGTTWVAPFTVAENSQLYILEERRYRLSGDVLQLIRNGDTAAALNVVDGITELQFRALFKPDPPNPTPPPQSAFGFGGDWTTLRAIEITLDGAVAHDDKLVARGFVTEIMPRNVLSK